MNVVSLDDGESESVAFEVAGGDTGAHRVDVGGQSGSFSVQQKGIPGFPVLSGVIGVLLGALILGLHRTNVMS